MSFSAVRVRTETGWQHVALRGEPGPTGPRGNTGATGAPGPPPPWVRSRTPYRELILQHHPTCYFRLGDTGAVAHDEMGGPDGVYHLPYVTQGQPSLLPGEPDARSTRFTGSAAGVPPNPFAFRVPHNPRTRLGAGAFSFELWFEFTDQTGAGHGGMMALLGPSTTNTSDRTQLVMNRNADNSPGGKGLNVYVGGGTQRYNNAGFSPPFTEPQRYHVVLRVSPADIMNAVLYRNGELLTRFALDLAPEDRVDATGGLTVAMAAGFGGWGHYAPFRGLYQEVAVYDYALSESRIRAHYATGRTP